MGIKERKPGLTRSTEWLLLRLTLCNRFQRKEPIGHDRPSDHLFLGGAGEGQGTDFETDFWGKHPERRHEISLKTKPDNSSISLTCFLKKVSLT